MEAIEFLKENSRMCHSYEFCGSCPLWGGPCIVAGIRSLTDSEFLTIISTVEQWSKEHPIITNAQEFKEVFGEIKIKDLIHIDYNCTSTIDELTIEVNETNWWNEPYKEPEHED